MPGLTHVAATDALDGSRAQAGLIRQLLDRGSASGARFGCVFANSGYGSGCPVRQALGQRDLLYPRCRRTFIES
jgi:hypothetical protein